MGVRCKVDAYMEPYSCSSYRIIANALSVTILSGTVAKMITKLCVIIMPLPDVVSLSQIAANVT